MKIYVSQNHEKNWRKGLKMLKEKDLIENVASYRIKDKENQVNFQSIKNVIENEVEDYGYKLLFRMDELKIGGMFNSSIEKVLVVTNADHPSDYFQYVFMLGKQGTFTLFNVYVAGQSKLIKKENIRQTNANNAGLVGLVSMNIAHKIHNNDAALAEEQGYYLIFEQDILSKIVE